MTSRRATSRCAWRRGDRGAVRLVDCSHRRHVRGHWGGDRNDPRPGRRSIVGTRFCVYGLNPKQLDRSNTASSFDRLRMERAAPTVARDRSRFVADSALEGSGFEPSVPLRECRRSEPLARKETSGVGNGVSSTGDRWFESGSLQRGVRCEPGFRGQLPLETVPGYARRLASYANHRIHHCRRPYRNPR
jgi:hypothetical protein